MKVCKYCPTNCPYGAWEDVDYHVCDPPLGRTSACHQMTDYRKCKKYQKEKKKEKKR